MFGNELNENNINIFTYILRLKVWTPIPARKTVIPKSNLPVYNTSGVRYGMYQAKNVSIL